MKFRQVLLKTLTGATLMLGGMTVASAALITEWSYYNEAGFTSFTPNPGVSASGNSGAELGLPTTLSWGDPATAQGQSQLVSGGNVGGTATTNGPANAGVTLTHNNREIWDGSTILESAILQSRLLLTPLDPAGAPLDPLEILFSIVFEETLNSPPGGICADGTPNGVGVNINGCADIFVVTNPGSLVDNFQIGGFMYTITVAASGLGPLSDSACAAVGQGNGCVGFLTVEQQSSTLSPFFTITASSVPTEIPVPATALLFGIGLLALGVTARRRRA